MNWSSVRDWYYDKKSYLTLVPIRVFEGNTMIKYDLGHKAYFKKMYISNRHKSGLPCIFFGMRGEWIINDQKEYAYYALHRKDGPAEDNKFYLDGKLINCSSLQEFKSYLKLHKVWQ